MLKKIRNKKGFTLIELIVVIAVIAILAAVLLPRFTGFSDKAKLSAAKTTAKSYADTIEAMIAEGTDPTKIGAAGAGAVGETAIEAISGDLGGTLNLLQSGGTFSGFTYRSTDGVTVTYSYANRTIS